VLLKSEKVEGLTGSLKVQFQTANDLSKQAINGMVDEVGVHTSTLPQMNRN
jgi:hypothetical protein